MTGLEHVPLPGEHRGVSDVERAALRDYLTSCTPSRHDAFTVAVEAPGKPRVRVFDIKLAGARNPPEVVDAGFPAAVEWFVAVCEADGAYVAGWAR